MKRFYTGSVINTEMLLVMLEKHEIIGRQEWEDPSLPDDDGDLDRRAHVLVPEADYDRAWQLFYAERECSGESVAEVRNLPKRRRRFQGRAR